MSQIYFTCNRKSSDYDSLLYRWFLLVSMPLCCHLPLTVGGLQFALINETGWKRCSASSGPEPEEGLTAPVLLGALSSCVSSGTLLEMPQGEVWTPPERDRSPASQCLSWAQSLVNLPAECSRPSSDHRQEQKSHRAEPHTEDGIWKDDKMRVVLSPAFWCRLLHGSR